MTINRRGAGFTVVFENSHQQVQLELSAGQMRKWGRDLAETGERAEAVRAVPQDA
jgi:hypothetical protein